MWIEFPPRLAFSVVPNLCENRLVVEGPRAELDRFRDALGEATEDPLKLGRIVMEPPPGDPRRVASDLHEDGWDSRNTGRSWNATVSGHDQRTGVAVTITLSR